MTATTLDFKQNHLLGALPERDLQRWQPNLEFINMSLGDVLYEPGATLSHVYFPTTAIVSLLYVMENGASAEIAVAGNEGLIGISLPHRARTAGSHRAPRGAGA